MATRQKGSQKRQVVSRHCPVAMVRCTIKRSLNWSRDHDQEKGLNKEAIWWNDIFLLRVLCSLS